jgi:hypothetical protein
MVISYHDSFLTNMEGCSFPPKLEGWLPPSCSTFRATCPLFSATVACHSSASHSTKQKKLLPGTCCTGLPRVLLEVARSLLLLPGYFSWCCPTIFACCSGLCWACLTVLLADLGLLGWLVVLAGRPVALPAVAVVGPIARGPVQGFLVATLHGW